MVKDILCCLLIKITQKRKISVILYVIKVTSEKVIKQASKSAYCAREREKEGGGEGHNGKTRNQLQTVYALRITT